MTLNFTEPAVGGSGVTPKQLENRLLLVWPIQHYPHVPTKYSEPGKKSDAVVCDIVDLTGDTPGVTPGSWCPVHRRVFIFQGHLQAVFRPRVGNGPLLGSVVKVASAPGEKGDFKWQFMSATGDADATQMANTWYASVGGEFTPSEKEDYVPPTPQALAPQQQPQYQQPQQQWGPQPQPTWQPQSPAHMDPRFAQQWQQPQPQWGQQPTQNVGYLSPSQQMQQPQPQYQQPTPPAQQWGQAPQQQMTPLQQMQQQQMQQHAQHEIQAMRADGMIPQQPQQQLPPPPPPQLGLYGQPQSAESPF